MIRFTSALLVFFFAIGHGIAAAHEEFAPEDTPVSATLLPPSYTEMESFRKTLTQPAKQSFSLNLMPKILEVKALYLEKQPETAAVTGSVDDPDLSKLGRYFDILATSSQFDGKLIGEGELAYSTLGLSLAPDDRPIMSRLGVRGNWNKMNYGLNYRSFGSGFISTTGVKVARARDENELWGEYDFQMFRLKTTLAEWREKDSGTSQITLTRTAGTSFNWSKPAWSAFLSSNYSLIGTAPNSQSAAFTNGLRVAYRPTGFLTIEPSLSFKQEWDQSSGLRTESPSAGIVLSGKPHPSLQLIGRASYSNSASDDPLKNVSTMSTLAGLNWKIGRTFLGEESLSFQLEYKSELRAPASSTPAQTNVAGMLQLKLAGF